MVQQDKDTKRDPVEKELDVLLTLTEQMTKLKQRVTHLETLEVTNSFVALDKTELTVDTSLITFANIPQIYASLKIIMSVRSRIVATSSSIGIRFNNDGGANYDSLRSDIRHSSILTTSENIAAGAMFIGSIVGDTVPADVFSGLELIIPDYIGANEKSLHGGSDFKIGNSTTNLRLGIFGGWWRDVSPITEIDLITASADDFAAGSKFYLYGIRAS